MSYDVTILNKSGKPIDLWLSVTYNYNAILQRVFQDEKGIYSLDGKLVKDTDLVPLLQRLSSHVPDDDYWAPTDGNVSETIIALIKMSELGRCADAEATWNVL